MRIRLVIPGILLGTMALACQPSVDLAAERAALLQTDLDWAAAASGGDVEHDISFWTDDAKVYPPGMSIVEGKAALRDFVTASHDIPGFSITWQPQEVVVSPDGLLGYTVGENRITAPGPDGAVETTVGRYVTVWRKEPDGSWKCAVDMWNFGPDQEEPETSR